MENLGKANVMPELKWLNAKPKHENAVLIISDRKYFPIASFLASRIADLEGEKDFDIVIAVNFEDKSAAFSDTGRPLVACFLGDDLFSGFFASKRFPSPIYYWTCIVDRLCGTYKRVLYLDTDIYPEKPVIGDLLGWSGLRKSIASAPDLWIQLSKAIYPRLHKKVYEKVYKTGGSEKGYLETSHIYRNSGVMLFDVEKYRANDHWNKIKKFAEANNNLLTQHDQSLLNLVIGEDTQLLSPELNFPQNFAQAIEDDPACSNSRFLSLNRRLVHFCGGYKPWELHSDNSPCHSRYYPQYERHIKEYFPNDAALLGSKRKYKSGFRNFSSESMRTARKYLSESLGFGKANAYRKNIDLIDRSIMEWHEGSDFRA